MRNPPAATARLQCTSVPAVRPVPSLAEDVRAGMLTPPRHLPPKYFYDDRGSRLFEAICATPEYYPSRTEAALLAAHGEAIMGRTEPRHFLELGSGSSRKTRYLLDAWPAADGGERVYWPFDVIESFLMESGAALVERYPWLTVRALVGDYNGGLAGLPLPAVGRRLVAFLGGTIGNFPPTEADNLLAEIAALLRPGDHLLLGVDRVKDAATLEAAYDDARGTTAAFNLNLLEVLNRTLDADFPRDAYRHRAVFNAAESRIEMRLVVARAHAVRLAAIDRTIELEAGEEILTEISRKFTRTSLAAMLSRAGLRESAHFEAPDGAYSLVLATPA